MSHTVDISSLLRKQGLPSMDASFNRGLSALREPVGLEFRNTIPFDDGPWFVLNLLNLYGSDRALIAKSYALAIAADNGISPPIFRQFLSAAQERGWVSGRTGNIFMMSHGFEQLALRREVRLLEALDQLGISHVPLLSERLLSAPLQYQDRSTFRTFHLSEMSVVLWSHPQGFELPFHSHETQDQWSAVISGKVTATVGERYLVCTPESEPLRIPAGQKHAEAASSNYEVVEVFLR